MFRKKIFRKCSLHVVHPRFEKRLQNTKYHSSIQILTPHVICSVHKIQELSFVEQWRGLDWGVWKTIKIIISSLPSFFMHNNFKFKFEWWGTRKTPSNISHSQFQHSPLVKKHIIRIFITASLLHFKCLWKIWSGCFKLDYLHIFPFRIFNSNS